MSALTFELARRRYAVENLSEVHHQMLQARFGKLERPPTLATLSADTIPIRIERSFDAASFRDRPPGPTEYRLSVDYGSDAVHVVGVGFRARIDRRTLSTHMVTCRDDAWFIDGFENLFRVVAAYRSFASGSLVLHSAAFTDGERGFVACGRSGAGKSTLCGLAERLGLTVLSDELNLIRATEEGFALQAMPFAGDFGRTQVGSPSLPLFALLGLQQDSTTRLSRCSHAQAVSRIVASCPYLNADPQFVDRVADRAGELVRLVPLRVLSFTLDTSFWKVLDHEYPRPRSAVSP